MFRMECLHCEDLMPRLALEDVCASVRRRSAVHQHLVCIYSARSVILFLPLPEGRLLLSAVSNTNPELRFHSHMCEPSALPPFFFLPASLEQSGRDPGSPVYGVIFRKAKLQNRSGALVCPRVCGQGWYRARDESGTS